MYRIKEITSKNSWYIIYAEKQDTLYKIISAKQENEDNNCKRIRVGRYYSFELTSRSASIPVINGVKLNPANYLDVKSSVNSSLGKNCYMYDDETEICVEPERGVHDLYYTNNLIGLCHIKL